MRNRPLFRLILMILIPLTILRVYRETHRVCEAELPAVVSCRDLTAEALVAERIEGTYRTGYILREVTVYTEKESIACGALFASCQGEDLVPCGMKIRCRVKLRKFEARHRARALAVLFLYSLEAHPVSDLEPALDLFLEMDNLAGEPGGMEPEAGSKETGESALKIKEETPEVKEYFRFLARGTWERWRTIDETLLRLVTGWRPERMVYYMKKNLQILCLVIF